jgi:signal transduction histidine kinase
MTPVGEERELSFWRRSRRLDRLVARYVVVLATVLGIVVLTFALHSKLDAQARAINTAGHGARRLDYYAQRSESIERAQQLVRYGSYGLIVLTILTVATYGYFSERSSAYREERLFRSVVGQRDTMARQSEWRRKIIAILAHDFRTSLTVIQANTELLETRPDVHMRSNAFRAIYRGIADLSSMTDEALLMARVANDTLTITPQPVFVYDLLAEAADRFSTRQDIRITLSDDYVLGDERYLARVFDNVISNAVKYSNGPIDVRIHGGEKTVEIDVTDRGPGIDAADLPHVFEEYWRAESALGKRGSGIGLYIVKKIVDAHQGTVTIESSAGEGTTVSVVLPRAKPETS